MDPMQAQIPAQTAGNPYNLVWGAAIPVQPVPQVLAQEMPQVQVTVQPAQISMSPVQIPVQQTSAAPSEGFLEKMIKWIVRLIAKASGNADPLTGQWGKPATAQPWTPAVAWNIQAVPQSGWFFGQIWGIFSGMAETAQGMVWWAVTWAQQIGQTAVSGVQQVGQTIPGIAQPTVAPAAPQAPVQEAQAPVQAQAPVAPTPPAQA